jgi:hypothetical protein
MKEAPESGHVRIYQFHADSDGDGILDHDDQCAGSPDGEAVDVNGCTESQKDSDNDGVSDADDQCADTLDGEAVDVNGCAESQKDSDNDGVSDADDQCADTPAGQIVDVNGCGAFQQQLELVNQQLQALQGQIDNISLTQGPQGLQGKVGATGADADCVACADVANGAVDLACLVLGEIMPTSFVQTQAAATVIVNTLLISTNICETDCDIGAEIDTLINAKMNP